MMSATGMSLVQVAKKMTLNRNNVVVATPDLVSHPRHQTNTTLSYRLLPESIEQNLDRRVTNISSPEDIRVSFSSQSG